MRRIRTRLLSAVVLAAVLAAAAGCTSSSSASSPGPPASPPGAAASGGRPDFVFVLTDDLSWNLVSHMPHVRALEKAGTTMSEYYVADSLCCPFRTAIFTGGYPYDDGVFTNAGSDGGYNAFNARGDRQKSFAVALRNAGLGEYRLDPGKQTAFDTDIHVPLIVTGPGVPVGRVAGQLTSNTDLCPTIETLAGLIVPAGVDGHSLADLWHGQDPANWRQAILIEHHGPDFVAGDPDRQTSKNGDPPSYEAVRTANALYVRYTNGQQEYYDTTTDPYELDNIAAKDVPAALPRALSAIESCHHGTACWTAAHLSQGVSVRP